MLTEIDRKNYEATDLASLTQVETAIKTIIYLHPEYHDYMVPDFSNDIYSLRPYSDADYENNDLENPLDDPPNFIHNESKFWVSWYKHPGRGLKWKPITVSRLREIVIECLGGSILFPPTA